MQSVKYDMVASTSWTSRPSTHHLRTRFQPMASELRAWEGNCERGKTREEQEGRMRTQKELKGTRRFVESV